MNEQDQEYDVIIIGGGPAGLSAAIWCADLGLRSLLVERDHLLGGQLNWTFNSITNYPGILSIRSTELRDRFVQHAESKKAELAISTSIGAIDLQSKYLRLDGGREFFPRAFVLATGVRRRKLGIQGEDEFTGNGILLSGVKAKDDVRNRSVVIIGGGDAAIENAAILAKTADRVTVVHRGRECSARNDLLEEAERASNIDWMLSNIPTAINGTSSVESVEVLDVKTQKKSLLLADAVLIRIGVDPNTESFVGQINLTDRGYVEVDAECRASLDMVYAIGDIANPHSPTIGTAAGMAATAVKNIERKLRNP